jgi:hypothetical protein
MKVYDIALGVFMFTYLLSFFSQLSTGVGMEPEYVVPEAYQDSIFKNYTREGNLENAKVIEYIDETKEKTEIVTGTDQTGFEEMDPWQTQALSVIGSFGIFMSALWSSTIGLCPLLIFLGVPVALAGMLSGIVYFIYFIGIFQIITGRRLDVGA